MAVDTNVFIMFSSSSLPSLRGQYGCNPPLKIPTTRALQTSLALLDAVASLEYVAWAQVSKLYTTPLGYIVKFTTRFSLANLQTSAALQTA